MGRAGITEGFAGETVDPVLHSPNGVRGNIVQRVAFWEETANEGILLLIQTSLIGRVGMSVVNGNIGT